jgi:hypothetical protein
MELSPFLGVDAKSFRGRFLHGEGSVSSNPTLSANQSLSFSESLKLAENYCFRATLAMFSALNRYRRILAPTFPDKSSVFLRMRWRGALLLEAPTLFGLACFDQGPAQSFMNYLQSVSGVVRGKAKKAK